MTIRFGQDSFKRYPARARTRARPLDYASPAQRPRPLLERRYAAAVGRYLAMASRGEDVGILRHLAILAGTPPVSAHAWDKAMEQVHRGRDRRARRRLPFWAPVIRPAPACRYRGPPGRRAYLLGPALLVASLSRDRP